MMMKSTTNGDDRKQNDKRTQKKIEIKSSKRNRWNKESENEVKVDWDRNKNSENSSNVLYVKDKTDRTNMSYTF